MGETPKRQKLLVPTQNGFKTYKEWRVYTQRAKHLGKKMESFSQNAPNLWNWPNSQKKKYWGPKKLDPNFALWTQTSFARVFWRYLLPKIQFSPPKYFPRMGDQKILNKAR